VQPRMIGITGPSASGKSILAQAVRAAQSDAVIVQQDWYFRSAAECPEDANFCELRWMHVDELVRDVAMLASGVQVHVPVMDFSTFERVGTTLLDPKSLVILEGMTILRIPEVDEHLDARFYVDIDMPTLAVRKLARDIHERRKPMEIVEAQLRWIEAEYLADEVLRQRGDVSVLSPDTDMAMQVRAILGQTARTERPQKFGPNPSDQVADPG